jgi:UDP-glucose 4-epimerase
MNKLHIITGAAGFVGSQLVDRLLESGDTVLGVDNLCRGSMANLAQALPNSRFVFKEADVTDKDDFFSAIESHATSAEMIWHLAANSDIAAGGSDPSIDLRDTFITSYNVGQACRKFGIRRLAFSSTSAIYGDHGNTVLTEDIGPLFPVSNYGAMKLASEAAFTALAEASLDRLWIFRFPNVVGGRATHGVIYDFLNKLEKNPNELVVLGDGSQCKPYLFVDDLLSAMRLIVETAKDRINFYNVGPDDEGVTVREIAELVVARAAIGAKIAYGEGNRGWIGDVPRFRYSIEKLKAMQWKPNCPSSRQAISKAVELQLQERRQGVR